MDEPKPMRELTRIREERGLSQQGLADASGVNKATINQIERGRRSPNLETLEKLADALTVEIADFFPKAQASLPLDSPVGGAEADEERAHYLHLFRVFIDEYVQRWEEEPPETFRETAPFNMALIAVLKEGVLEPPWLSGPKELEELDRLSDGLERSHEVAAKVKRKERTESTKREAS
jgi:transcriptional regulator with XRE-family HTH domain